MDGAAAAAAATARAGAATPTLDLCLVAIRREAEGIHSYEFQPLDGRPLPAFTAGAHVDIHLPAGPRQYSLCNPQDERHRYVVAVKRDPHGRGGSAWLHEHARVGESFRLSAPRNHFPLREDAAHTVLLAGGIGITPIACMVQRLRALGRSWELHYGVRHRDEAAFVDLLGTQGVHLHVDSERGTPLPLATIVAGAAADAHLYCCGPGPMLETFEQACRSRPASHVSVERFAAAQPAATGGGFTVRLARTGLSVQVEPGNTILEALRARGVEIQASCEQGICGTCETRVLAGRPDHRDSLLSDEEKASNQVMMVCCSGSRDPLLVLDL